MTGNTNDATQEFITEADEVLERLTVLLSKLEKNENYSNTVHSIYRDVHSLKGSAQLFGYHQIGTLAHCLEAIMEPVRSQKIPTEARLIDKMYHALDVIRSQVNNLRTVGTEKPSDEFKTIIPTMIDIALQSLAKHAFPLTDDCNYYKINHRPLEKHLISSLTQHLDSTSAKSPSEKPVRSPDLDRIPGAAQEVKTSSFLTPITKDVGNSVDNANNESIRVPIGVLDKLMNLVGELVLIRNQVIQTTNTNNVKPEFQNLSQRLSVVTTELQTEVMKTRMQPIDNVVSRFHRVARDMARELGKSVDLILEGTDTEVDKTLIEAIKDPLTHIVRNAIDHGIETPTERRLAKKTETGALVVRAFHEGGRVIIEVRDDGRGASRSRIVTKAIERNLISQENAAKISDRDILQLLFTPGFSTADRVSDLSGRGVGLDVVKNNVERIGGSVEIESTDGKGTTIRLKIPLTLAIIPALIIRVGDDRFAIPQIKLVELLKAERCSENQIRGIEMLQGKPVYRLRGSLLPLVTLTETLEIGDFHNSTSESANIVVLNTDNGYFGLVVDEILDSTDIVVKPLTSFLKSLGVFSGATVLGDGSVILTLDVLGLATKANMFEDAQKSDIQSLSFSQSTRKNDEISDYLLIDIGAKSRYAIPLCLVNRLEEFKRSAIELSGNQRVVRYRETILPLLSISDHLNLNEISSTVRPVFDDNLPVVVVDRGGRLFGLEVHRILDVLSTENSIDDRIRDRPEILGSIISDNSVVVIIDILSIIDQHLGREPASVRAITSLSTRQQQHILIVEDNAFFRRQVSKALVSAGFQVSNASDGAEGFEQLITSPSKFNAVLSDIEMPRMNGFELAKKIKQTGQIANIPMIALTTKFRTVDQEEGQRVGFSRYLEKLNSDHLIAALDDVLGIKEA